MSVHIYLLKMICLLFMLSQEVLSGAVGKSYGGDPHFLVSSQSEDPICFNYAPTTSSDLILIFDPESSLLLTARTQQHSNGQNFMIQIFVKTPEGVTFEINAEKPHLKFSGENKRIQHFRKTGEVSIGGV